MSRLTQANFDQIHENMSKEEVKAILGSPSSSSTEDKLIYKRTTWRYVEGDKYINVTFKNDELDSKDTNWVRNNGEMLGARAPDAEIRVRGREGSVT